MSELSYLVLVSLSSGRRHGYGILTDLHQITAEATRPRVATLYRTLDRLVSEGLVVVDGTDVVDGRFRRYYRLTDVGVAGLDEQIARQEATARVARQRLKAHTAGGAVGLMS
jgi:PadR family transcriptional regulator PadR